MKLRKRIDKKLKRKKLAEIVTLENGKIVNSSLVSSDKFFENSRDKEYEILGNRDYGVLKRILEKKLGGKFCYEFFDRVGFIPLEMKEEYIEGKKIYNENMGHYTLEEMN